MSTAPRRQGGGSRPRLGQGWSTAAMAAAPNPHVDTAVYVVSLALAAGMRLASDCREPPPPGSGRWGGANHDVEGKETGMSSALFAGIGLRLGVSGFAEAQATLQIADILKEEGV